MNAFNLTPIDSHGTLDPYIRIHILFPNHFMHPNLKTQTYVKSTSCIIDETFMIPLTTEQSQCSDALIKLTVKHQGKLRFYNTPMSECFIKFEDIFRSTDKKFMCKLWKLLPDKENSILKIIEFRRDEPVVREYFKQIQR